MMLTVILAEKNVFDSMDRYKMYLTPLIENEQIALCPINTDENSLDMMAPTLYDIIANSESWRAVIVCPCDRETDNPFDFVQHHGGQTINDTSDLTCDELVSQLRERFDLYRRALENPLARLSYALAGRHTQRDPQEIASFHAVIDGEKSLDMYMLERCMNSSNVTKKVLWLRKFGNPKLESILSDGEKFEQLMQLILKRDAVRIIELIGKENVLSFLNAFSENDPHYTDPAFTLSELEEIGKEELLSLSMMQFKLFNVQPADVECVALRSCGSTHRTRTAPDFARFNLYPEKMNFFVFDILPEKHRQYELDYIRFLATLLIFSANRIPQGIVTHGKLYCMDSEMDRERFVEICRMQDAKLRATRRAISKRLTQKKFDSMEPLDGEEAKRIFEAKHLVVVDIVEYDKSRFLSNSKGIGLSADCPTDEYKAWKNQYKEIEKRLVRYLREPRRAVKRAVKSDFAENGSIIDERAVRLNEYQLEDIGYVLQEEEQAMVETTTTKLFETEAYLQKIQDAEKEVSKEIRHRMTKSRTISVALVAAGAFLLGFLPMLFNTGSVDKASLVSFLTVIFSLALFLLIGFVYLFVLRRKLKNKYEGFNSAVKSVFAEIMSGLKGFSDYLSHACNTMRESSVLRQAGQAHTMQQNVLKKHLSDVDDKIEEIRGLYAGYIQEDNIYNESDPFAFDFSLPETYNYDMEYPIQFNNVVFMTNGYFVTAPVDYIKSITVLREDLYE